MFSEAAQRFALPDQRVGVESAWKQEKLEARKMLEKAADSRWSGARFVRCVRVAQDFIFQRQNRCFQWLDFTRAVIIYKPDFFIETNDELKKHQSWGLAKTFAKNWLREKFTLLEKWTW